MTHALKYTGTGKTTFTEVGEVEPGGTFEVDDSRLPGFMRRGDVEHDGKCPAEPCKCGEEPPAEAPVRRRPRSRDSAGD